MKYLKSLAAGVVAVTATGVCYLYFTVLTDGDGGSFDIRSTTEADAFVFLVLMPAAFTFAFFWTLRKNST